MTNLSVKHAHNEAFKLMTYACVCGHRETIWNSRDGVTPFGMECLSCGGMYLRHIDWKSDVYAPDHQLHKDQRFWRDGTPDEAEAIMRRRIEAYRDEHPCTPEKEAELIRIAREGEGEFRRGWPMLDRLERRDLTPSPADRLRVRPATAEDVNRAFDPANEVLGGAFMAGFREGWIYSEIDADGERYQEMAEEYAMSVDTAPGEAWDAHREKFLAMLPLAAIPEMGAPIANIEAEIASVVQSVNEWDDRTSPDDYPDHLLITSEELADILRNFAAMLEGSADV